MRKFIAILFAGVIGIMPGINAARANGLEFDTSDPLFMMQTRDILSETSLTYWDNILRLQQTLSYGINDRLSIGINANFQQDFDGPEDGFGAVDLGGVYRVGTAAGNSAYIISDVLKHFLKILNKSNIIPIIPPISIKNKNLTISLDIKFFYSPFPYLNNLFKNPP